jgi:molecular chaperone GrpE
VSEFHETEAAKPPAGEAGEGGPGGAAPTDRQPRPSSPETTFDDAEAPAAAPPVAETIDAEPVEQPAAPSSEEQAAQYLALAQRTQADFENYRKRVARDAAVALDRGVRKLASELFPALDHLDAALQAIGDPEIVKGVRLVQDEFTAALRRVGIEPFSPEGEVFDPNEHEAMAQQPAEGVETGRVVSVYQQGYRHNGQVLRPARVVVAA